MARFKKGDIVYWWGTRCEVLDGPKWPIANPVVPPEFDDPKKDGPRHHLYGDKPDRRTKEWREQNPVYLVRRSDGYVQYLLQDGLSKDRADGDRKGAFLATVIELYTLLSVWLTREEHRHFLNVSDRDPRRARAYLAKKGVVAQDINKAMRLAIKIRQ